MKAEIKACLIASLENGLDHYMAEHGFKRAKGGLTYERELRGSTQTIDLPIQIHPKDNPNAAAAIYPRMEVHNPLVDSVLDKMIDGNLGLLEGVTAGRSNQPIGFTSEKQDPGRWFVYQPDSVPEIVKDIRSFIERWTMPFLDIYATPQEIVGADERDDGRMVRDRAQMMRVVAAAIVCNRRDHAQAVMDKWLGKPGTRRRYQQVQDYIENAVFH